MEMVIAVIITCGVRTNETILAQLCVACEPAHLFHHIFFLLEEYDCVGIHLVRHWIIVTFDNRLVSGCASGV